MVNEEEGNDLIIKMRGLPWSATIDDVTSFLEDVQVRGGKEGVHLTISREGRPSGEAFIELETFEDVDKALQKDKQLMGHRYIEIFKTTRADMQWFIAKSGDYVDKVVDQCCIRLRGLPYGCTKNDIAEFFSGLTIVPNGISFVSDQTGRNTGEAFVQFVNKEMVEKALKKHLDKIGHRYIEIFRSSLTEINSQTGPKIRPLMSKFVPRPTPYDRDERYGGPNRFGCRPQPPPRFRSGGDVEEDWDSVNSWGGNVRKPVERNPNLGAAGYHPSGKFSAVPAVRARNTLYGTNQGGSSKNWGEKEQKFLIHLRGLPFKATEQDIANFFYPLVPINVNIIYEKPGRPSGEATVEFETFDDACNAMEKDKQNMNNRYIELFLKARPPPMQSTPGQMNRNYMGTRNASNYHENNVCSNSDALFSRRGGPSIGVSGSSSGGGGGGSVSNSAYDGFYGTSTYQNTAASKGWT